MYNVAIFCFRIDCQVREVTFCFDGRPWRLCSKTRMHEIVRSTACLVATGTLHLLLNAFATPCVNSRRYRGGTHSEPIDISVNM